MGQDQKREAIIEAAIKRFAHFGVAKTTMSEIGADLSISKASLYYYFPDKMHLYAAVLKHITGLSEESDDKLLNEEADPNKAILLFLELRTNFIIKYYNILEYLKTYTPATMPPELQSLFNYLRERELKRITAILENGRKQKKYLLDDVKKTAELFFDFLDGFRFSILGRNSNFFPDKKQFQSILKREKEFATIFFKGLSFNNS